MTTQTEPKPAVEPTPQALEVRRLDPQALIVQALEKDSPVEVIERLLAMAERVREIQAREAWYAAMAQFQRTCPPIKKTKVAKMQSDRAAFSYAYAPLDEILETTRPVMGPLGLSVSWRTRFENKMVIANCRVSHEAGHYEESGEVPIPIDEASKMGATIAQRIGIATTYGKRYALLAVIGIAPEDDDDAAHGDKPRSTVQQPRRTTDAAAATPEPPDGTEKLVGVISEVSAKPLKRPDGSAYTKWGIKVALPEGEESIWVSTFSESFAESAKQLKEAGELVTVWYKREGQYTNLVDLSAVPFEG